MDIQNYIKAVFQIKTESDFNDLAIKLFHYQYNNNKVYREYIKLIGHKTHDVTHYKKIPFLPIELFRNKKIITEPSSAQNSTQTPYVFNSSGTTSSNKSKHYVIDIEIYKRSILESFKLFVGEPEDFTFLCLVPNNTNNPSSSLSFMCAELIKKSNQIDSGFYLNRKDALKAAIEKLQKQKKRFILFGLSFETLDFAENNNISLTNSIVIETGGIKNKNKHIIREELHQRLASCFNTKNIYSEYGMAELLSQSYYTTNQCFESPPWKKVLIRDKTNPLRIIDSPQRGCVNIIDLANVHSCGFLATNDFGQLTNNGFHIIGRAQNATLKGCSLMV